MTDLKPEDGVRHRIMAHEPVSDDANFLMTGGEGQYLDYCPEHGCAAVILKRDGSLVHGLSVPPRSCKRSAASNCRIRKSCMTMLRIRRVRLATLPMAI